MQSPELATDHAPDTLSTPEGDNEYMPEEPLAPDPAEPERPRGDAPHSTEPLYPALD